MPASTHTELLIVGAGPFGLALAAHARHLGVDPLVVGEPMGFWKRHMPKGMYLRSACDWHLDPEGIDTIEAYLAAQTPGTSYKLRFSAHHDIADDRMIAQMILSFEPRPSGEPIESP